MMENDRTRFVELLYYIFMESTIVNLKELKDIIGRNQNDPPLGLADGSFSEEEWTAARDTYNALIEFQNNFQRIRRT